MEINTDRINASYKKASKLFDENEKTVPFVFQFGPKYHSPHSARILFVGKSVNGWVESSKSPDDWFDLECSTRLYKRENQITWVLDLEGPNDEYNTKKSAFWRLIRRITDNSSEKFHEIAWTNLYKFSPYLGNPTADQRRKQFEHARDIFLEEISILQPKTIVFLTSGWEKPFIGALSSFSPSSEITWDGYTTSVGQWNGIKIIISVHPQGKSEEKHALAIRDGIENVRLL